MVKTGDSRGDGRTRAAGAPIPVAAPTRLSDDEATAIRAAIERVLVSGSLVLGPIVEEFEEHFSRYLDPVGPHVVAVGSGTDALTLGLAALQLPAHSMVAVAANEGGFAAAAIAACGLTPLVTDVNPLSRALDVNTLAADCSAKLSAVVVTHLHGMQCDLTALSSFCRSRDLALVEDCSHAHGARRAGRHAGLEGDLATFSFYPTKNLGALGDGGAVVTTSQRVAQRVRVLREYGWGERHKITVPQGRNSRLDALQAAVLSARLAFLQRNNEARRAVVERYQAALKDSSVSIFAARDGFVAHHAVVTGPAIDSLKKLLMAREIQYGHHYPFLSSEMPGLTVVRGSDLRIARGLRDTSISLPCFPGLRKDEVDTVCAVLEQWSYEQAA